MASLNIPLSISATTSSITDAIASCAVSCKDISDGLARVSQALSKLNINVFTPEGEYRNIGDVLEEAYNIYDESFDSLLRPETSEKTENSNEKGSFDFLEENAYNELKLFFDGVPKPEYLMPLDFN